MARAFALLEALDRGPRRFGDLEEDLGGLGGASLSRLLDDLVALGQVTHREGHYHLGVRARRPDLPSLLKLPEVAAEPIRACLKNLALRHLRSVGIMEPLGRMCMRIGAMFNMPDGAAFSRVGREQGLHVTQGFARVFLAYRDEEELRDAYALMSHLSVAVRPSWEELVNDLTAVRRLGQVVEAGMHQGAVTRYAVPVALSGEGPHFALGLIGEPINPEDIPAVWASLEQGAHTIQSVLGFLGPWPNAPTGSLFSSAKSDRTKYGKQK